jgi:hypothetical protein
MRVSPLERKRLLRRDGARDPLMGSSWGHFGAFFSRRGRENDYLWGRLDAAERLITLLLDDPARPGLREPDPEECKKAFTAIIEDEARFLGEVGELLGDLRTRQQDL